MSKQQENCVGEKPKACRMKNPVTGKMMFLGCAEAARWLVATHKIAKISTSTIRAIADGRAEHMQYNPETVKLVRAEFPMLCGVAGQE